MAHETHQSYTWKFLSHHNDSNINDNRMIDDFTPWKFFLCESVLENNFSFVCEWFWKILNIIFLKCNG